MIESLFFRTFFFFFGGIFLVPVLLRPGDLGLFVVLGQAVQVVVELFDFLAVVLARLLPDPVCVLED